MNGLSGEELIGQTWASASVDGLKKAFPAIEIPSDGVIYSPSAVGIELYLWAHGLSSVPPREFLTCDFVQMRSGALAISDGSVCLAP